MILSFSTQINGHPNYFIEKIWDFLIENGIQTQKELSQYQFDHFEQFGKHWDGQCIKHNPKLHTIRRDEKDRWKAGNKINPVIKPNGRFSAGFQFAPTFPCISTQKIEMVYETNAPNIYIDKQPFYYHTRRNTFGKDKMLELAINDGFNSVEDFFAYFNTDFKGKLIHWTDKRY